MQVLEINPIVGFVANYLCLVLGYLCKFLYYKTKWLALKKFTLKKKLYSYSGHYDITRWDPLIGPVKNAFPDSGHKFELSSITQAQSKQEAKFQQRRKKISHN